MQKIQVPAELTTRLGQVGYPAALCDETGATRAIVLPPELFDEMFHIWADKVFDREGLQQARNEPGGLTTAEAVAYLRKLEAEHRRP